VRIGGKLFTSVPWLEEFGKAVAEADAAYFDARAEPMPRPPRALTLTQKQHQADLERANMELDAAGI